MSPVVTANPRLTARAASLLGESALADGDVGAAAGHFERAAELWRGLDPWMLGLALDRVAELAQARGDLERAASAYNESLGETPQALSVDVSLGKVAALRREAGDSEEADRLDAERDALAARAEQA